jgi:hypothetical protein
MLLDLSRVYVLGGLRLGRNTAALWACTRREGGADELDHAGLWVIATTHDTHMRCPGAVLGFMRSPLKNSCARAVHFDAEGVRANASMPKQAVYVPVLDPSKT